MWQDYIRFGELFGMPRSAAPPSYPEFREWWEELLRSEKAFLTPQARRAGRETGFGIPVPLVNQPGMRVLELLLLGTLPQRARELYRLPWGRRERLAFEAAAAATRRSRVLTPRRLRRGSCEFLFDIVASTERRRIRSGRVSRMFGTSTSA
jgi:uncharacterized protein (DUF2236 family)